jgi:hypothetical protein
VNVFECLFIQDQVLSCVPRRRLLDDDAWPARVRAGPVLVPRERAGAIVIRHARPRAILPQAPTSFVCLRVRCVVLWGGAPP